MILLAKKLLQRAVKKCYKKDSWLIINNMEQASVARIFYYMQEIINKEKKFKDFRQLNLDCEYYKAENHKKIVENYKDGIRPDIILHKRNTSEHNILIIEFKSHTGKMIKDKNGNENDIEKLKVFTQSNNDYHYNLGIFVRLNHDYVEYIYFEKGKELNNESLPINNEAIND